MIAVEDNGTKTIIQDPTTVEAARSLWTSTVLPFNLPAGQYRTILIDAPWRFFNWSAKGEEKNPVSQYECLTMDQIRALPIRDLAHPDGCVIVSWATAPLLPEQIGILKDWGFDYSSMGAWPKRSKTGRTWAFGTGYRFRSAVEPFLLGTVNDPPLLARNVRNLLEGNVRAHSQKPDSQYAMCEALGAGPRCELFARVAWPGWDAWGNDLGKFDPPAVVKEAHVDEQIT
jgi:N6-adenosine-specific RNA methylase IME4